MASLKELAEQGDPGTLQSEDRARNIKLKTPQELYELWENQHWLSQEIDFSQDKSDFAGLDDHEREHLLWLLASFFIGEERVTTQFSGLVMSYDDEQEEAFLATQQVDEARHMQFFDRFYAEVLGYDNPDIAGRLQRTREHLNESFVKLFDESLVEAGDALIRNPRDVEAKVDFVATYHMVIEGALALTGQNYITDYLEKNELLPGFVDGFGKVARDEHRHVAYGTWFLANSAGQDEALAERLRGKLQELIPYAAGVLTPPGYNVGDDFELLGYRSHEVNEFAFKSLTRRLNAIGVPLQPEAVPA